MSSIPISIGVSGHYTAHVIDREGQVKRTIKGDNIITDVGIEQILSRYGGEYSCGVGSGSTTPTYDDVTLESQEGPRSSGFSIHSRSWWSVDRPTELPRYNSVTLRFTWNRGDVSGQLREVGVWEGNNVLVSRSLLNVSLEDTDQLVMFWEFRLYIPTGDHYAGEFVINGTDTDVTVRPLYTACKKENRTQHPDSPEYSVPLFAWDPWCFLSSMSRAFGSQASGWFLYEEDRSEFFGEEEQVGEGVFSVRMKNDPQDYNDYDAAPEFGQVIIGLPHNVNSLIFKKPVALMFYIPGSKYSTGSARNGGGWQLKFDPPLEHLTLLDDKELTVHIRLSVTRE